MLLLPFGNSIPPKIGAVGSLLYPAASFFMPKFSHEISHAKVQMRQPCGLTATSVQVRILSPRYNLNP